MAFIPAFSVTYPTSEQERRIRKGAVYDPARFESFKAGYSLSYLYDLATKDESTKKTTTEIRRLAALDPEKHKKTIAELKQKLPAIAPHINIDGSREGITDARFKSSGYLVLDVDENVDSTNVVELASLLPTITGYVTHGRSAQDRLYVLIGYEPPQIFNVESFKDLFVGVLFDLPEKILEHTTKKGQDNVDRLRFIAHDPNVNLTNMRPALTEAEVLVYIGKGRLIRQSGEATRSQIRSRRNYRPHTDIEQESVFAMRIQDWLPNVLSRIDPGDRDTWWRTAKSVRSLSEIDSTFELFCAWASTAANHMKPGDKVCDCRRIWDEKANPGKQITVGSLYELASMTKEEWAELQQLYNYWIVDHHQARSVFWAEITDIMGIEFQASRLSPAYLEYKVKHDGPAYVSWVKKFSPERTRNREDTKTPLYNRLGEWRGLDPVDIDWIGDWATTRFQLRKFSKKDEVSYESLGFANSNELGQALHILRARKVEVNPVREWLDEQAGNAPRHGWDGQDRVETLLIRYFNLDKDPDYQSKRWQKYFKEVAKTFMVSLLGRALNPGCVLPWVMVLHSLDQGVGKGRFLRNLFPPEFPLTMFHEQYDWNWDSLEILSQMAGCILGENAEGLGFDSKLLRQVKAQITSDSVKARVLYSMASMTFWKSFTLVVTSNDPKPLPADDSGSRRFRLVPIRAYSEAISNGVGRLQQASFVGTELPKEIRQVWLETYHKMESGIWPVSILAEEPEVVRWAQQILTEQYEFLRSEKVDYSDKVRDLWKTAPYYISVKGKPCFSLPGMLSQMGIQGNTIGIGAPTKELRDARNNLEKELTRQGWLIKRTEVLSFKAGVKNPRKKSIAIPPDDHECTSELTVEKSENYKEAFNIPTSIGGVNLAAAGLDPQYAKKIQSEPVT